ncbi:MAG TPA: aldehyde dehydrogenase family protein, partial [Pseudonocardia sp.]
MAIATINPATGETVKTFEATSDAEVQRKIGIGHQRWTSYRNTGFEERATLLRASADLLEKEVDEVARLMTTEMGKT